MKKLLLFCSALLVSACTIQVTEPADEPETYCYLRKIYYSEACGNGKYATEENCNNIKHLMCTDFTQPSECVFYDTDAYLQVEECTEVYKK